MKFPDFEQCAGLCAGTLGGLIVGKIYGTGRIESASAGNPRKDIQPPWIV